MEGNELFLCIILINLVLIDITGGLFVYYLKGEPKLNWKWFIPFYWVYEMFLND